MQSSELLYVSNWQLRHVNVIETAQAMASFVAVSIAPKQASATVSRGVTSAFRAPQPPPAEAVLADVQSVVESVLGAHVPADQPLMQV